MAVALLPFTTGCKSYWIDAEVENRSGHAIHELEVHYPTASFGANALEDGAAMHYRLQIRGSGPIQVEYADAIGKTVRSQGLQLTEREHGQLIIRILPGEKVDFVPRLQPGT